MPETLAFLSYTRKDDEFFGGYITAFRKVLENAVEVVTGRGQFRLFQDIEGIVIGEKWQKRLNEVIREASFFIPMLSPLFFNSNACRDEVSQFLKHERKLNRDDLILPVYFLDCPKLEKKEERDKDPMAKDLAARQIFDWRQRANVPLEDPAARNAIIDLARAIAAAMERLEGSAPHLRTERDSETLAADSRIGVGVMRDTKRESPSIRKVLWVDDNPKNNDWERRALEGYGIRFVLAQDTDEAERLISDVGPFAAIISDMGRIGDHHAGRTLLGRLRKVGIDTPYFVYTSSAIAKLWALPQLHGAQGITADPDELVEMVVAASFREDSQPHPNDVPHTPAVGEGVPDVAMTKAAESSAPGFGGSNSIATREQPHLELALPPSDAAQNTLVDFIRQFPLGPPLPCDILPRPIRQKLHLITGTTATGAILEANALRRAASHNESETAILIVGAPDIGRVGPEEFWQRVFNEATLKGPQMTVALLLCLPRNVLYGLDEQISKFLQSLRNP